MLVTSIHSMFFRRLFPECFQQRLVRLPAGFITPALFALWHFRFLQAPGIAGWIATTESGALGRLCALWAQRAQSLCAPVAAHAAYNATLTLTLAALLLTMA